MNILKHCLFFITLFCLSGCASTVKQSIQTYKSNVVDKNSNKKISGEELSLGKLKDYCHLQNCISYREYGPAFETGFRADIIKKDGKITGYDSFFHFFESNINKNSQPFAILFPGYGMTTEHSAHFTSWLKSIGYHVFALQGPTEGEHFDFNITTAKVVAHLLKQEHNAPDVTLVSLSMGSVAALHFIQEYEKLEKYLAVAPMQRFDKAAIEYSKLYASKSKLSWFTPKSSIDNGIEQVIQESGVDVLQTDFIHVAKQTQMPSTVILASEGDTISPSSLYQDLNISNVAVDIIPFFKHWFFSTMATPSEYSAKTIEFITPKSRDENKG